MGYYVRYAMPYIQLNALRARLLGGARGQRPPHIVRSRMGVPGVEPPRKMVNAPENRLGNDGEYKPFQNCAC